MGPQSLPSEYLVTTMQRPFVLATSNPSQNGKPSSIAPNAVTSAFPSPVVELFEAPASSRAASSKATGLDQIPGIALSSACLPIRAVIKRAGHRGGVRDLFCGPNTIFAAVFLAGIARPPLLMRRPPRHAADSAK